MSIDLHKHTPNLTKSGHFASKTIKVSQFNQKKNQCTF